MKFARLAFRYPVSASELATSGSIGYRRIVGAPAQEFYDLPYGDFRLPPGQQMVGHHQGTGIDQRIARNSALLLELDDGIERRSRRLASQAAPERLPGPLQHQRQRE